MTVSASKAPASNRPESFQIKGGLFPMNLLEVKTLNLETIRSELEIKVKKAPTFFHHSPVVLGFELLPQTQHDDFDLRGLIHICRDLGMLPAATRSATGTLLEQSITAGLAVLQKGREKHVGAITEKPMPELGANTQTQHELKPNDAQTETDPTHRAFDPKTKIVTTPIRSGQQVYAQGGDLVILSSVSPGAEVLADGNIHIYGALRGRALAGVKGDESARIFCSSQEAELVAVAGHFMVDQQLRDAHWQSAVQIHIENDNLIIRLT